MGVISCCWETGVKLCHFLDPPCKGSKAFSCWERGSKPSHSHGQGRSKTCLPLGRESRKSSSSCQSNQTKIYCFWGKCRSKSYKPLVALSPRILHHCKTGAGNSFPRATTDARQRLATGKTEVCRDAKEVPPLRPSNTSCLRRSIGRRTKIPLPLPLPLTSPRS